MPYFKTPEAPAPAILNITTESDGQGQVRLFINQIFVAFFDTGGGILRIKRAADSDRKALKEAGVRFDTEGRIVVDT